MGTVAVRKFTLIYAGDNRVTWQLLYFVVTQNLQDCCGNFSLFVLNLPCSYFVLTTLAFCIGSISVMSVFPFDICKQDLSNSDMHCSSGHRN